MTDNEQVHHPLGWPPGSVRGMLALLIAVQFWFFFLLPDSQDPTKQIRIPITLYFLMTLVGLFLVSHGKTIGMTNHRSPLFLPSGTLRVLIIGGTAAVLGFVYSNHPDRLTERLSMSSEQLTNWPMVVGSYVGGFFAGHLSKIMPFRNNWMIQAFLAWLAMIAMGLLFLEIIVRTFIDPSLKEKFDLHLWGAVVTGIVTFYFGARS